MLDTDNENSYVALITKFAQVGMHPIWIIFFALPLPRYVSVQNIGVLSNIPVEDISLPKPIPKRQGPEVEQSEQGKNQGKWGDELSGDRSVEPPSFRSVVVGEVSLLCGQMRPRFDTDGPSVGRSALLQKFLPPPLSPFGSRMPYLARAEGGGVSRENFLKPDTNSFLSLL